MNRTLKNRKKHKKTTELREMKKTNKNATPNTTMKNPSKKLKKPNQFIEIGNNVDPQTEQTKSFSKSKKGRTEKAPSTKFVEDTLNENGKRASTHPLSKQKKKKMKKSKSSLNFIESNLNDENETKKVQAKLQKQKEKVSIALGVDPTLPTEVIVIESDDEKAKGKVNEPTIPVYKVPIDPTTTSSESDNDSYIEKFFGDDGSDFDENRILSPEEIEDDKMSDFLSVGSETDLSDSASDNRSESSDECSANNVSTMQKFTSNTAQSESDDHESNTDDDSDDFFDYFDENEGEYISDNEDFGQYDGTSDSSGVDEEDSDEYEDESEEDEFESGDSDELTSDESDENSTYDDFMTGNYHDDSNDTDYSVDEAEDDLRIVQGTAITYRLTDRRVRMFENENESCIIELPQTDSEDESCIELVSLNVTRKEVQLKDASRRLLKEQQQQAEKLKKENAEKEYKEKLEKYYSQTKQSRPSRDENRELAVVKYVPSIRNCQPGMISEHPVADILRIENTQQADDLDEIIPITNEDVSSSEIIRVDEPPICKPMIIHLSEDDFDMQEDEEYQTEDVHMDEVGNGTADDELEVVEEEEDHETENVANVFDDETETNDSFIGLDGTAMSEGQRISDRNMSLSKSELTKTKPKFYNSINSRHVLLLLRNIIYVHGNLHVKLVAGNAQIFGYKLKVNETVTVHSTRGHALIYFTPVEKQRTNCNEMSNFNALHELKNDFLSQDIDTVIQEFNENTDAILLLERDNQNKGIVMIDRYMRETFFPNINAFKNDNPNYASEFILHAQFSFRPRTGLQLSDNWSTIQLNRNSRLTAIGGKGVGKSTFVRYTINSNLEKFDQFLFIDLDIGQPELFAPQTISATVLTEPIIGPGYLKNIPPTKALYFGEINVLLNPIKYLQCVIELHRFCSASNEFKNMPWIINTMGYTRGFGLELMACILRIFSPTDVVQIQSDLPNDNFDLIMRDKAINSFNFKIFNDEMNEFVSNSKFKTHVFSAIAPQQRSADLLPKDIRYAMVLSKLGGCLRNNFDWLTSVKPIEAQISDLEIVVSNEFIELDSELIATLLNANLVYLCERRNDLHKDVIECHGIGIVRAVDMSTEKLYLLPSIPLEQMTKVNVLAIGAIPLPSAVLLNQHSQIHGIVPYVYNSDRFVGSKQVAHHIFRSGKNRNEYPNLITEH